LQWTLAGTAPRPALFHSRSRLEIFVRPAILSAIVLSVAAIVSFTALPLFAQSNGGLLQGKARHSATGAPTSRERAG